MGHAAVPKEKCERQLMNSCLEGLSNNPGISSLCPPPGLVIHIGNSVALEADPTPQLQDLAAFLFPTRNISDLFKSLDLHKSCFVAGGSYSVWGVNLPDHLRQEFTHCSRSPVPDIVHQPVVNFLVQPASTTTPGIRNLHLNKFSASINCPTVLISTFDSQIGFKRHIPVFALHYLYFDGSLDRGLLEPEDQRAAVQSHGLLQGIGCNVYNLALD